MSSASDKDALSKAVNESKDLHHKNWFRLLDWIDDQGDRPIDPQELRAYIQTLREEARQPVLKAVESMLNQPKEKQ